MHDEPVETRRWIAERRLSHGLDVCLALPGPEPQQLASSTGSSMSGARGAATWLVEPGSCLDPVRR